MPEDSAGLRPADIIASRRNTPRKPQQERGRLRFETILDALESLLAETDWDQIGYYQLVERAGIPAASIYHYFPSKPALAMGLADRYAEHFRDASKVIAEEGVVRRWQDLVAILQKRAVVYYNSHPAAMKLLLGSQPFMEIRHSDSTTNRIVSDRNFRTFRRMYKLPPIDDPQRKFLIGVAIGDAVWRTSFDEHGFITPEYEDEAIAAVVAFLRTFLPEDLEVATARDPGDDRRPGDGR
jgi:AcrR family transcriptional regulator